MNNILLLTAMVLTGFGVGLFFFGALWYTVQKALTAKMPALWFIGSFLVRMAVTLMVLFFATQGELQRLAACVAGFIAARMAVTRFTKGKTLNTSKEQAYEAKS